MNRGFISVLPIILLVLIAGGVGYWAWTQTSSPQGSIPPAPVANGVLQTSTTSVAVITVSSPVSNATSTEPADITYQDTKDGVSFTYLSFGRPSHVFTQTNGLGGTTYTVSYLASSAPTAGPLPYVDTFILQLGPNPSLVPLQQWFAANEDSSGTLIKSGAFTHEVLSNGIDALFATGPLPDDGLGPIENTFAMTSSRKTLIIADISADSALHDLGQKLTEENVNLLLRNILESLMAP